MKKAFGLLELLIASVVIVIIYFLCFSGNQYGRSNPFGNPKDLEEVKTRQEIVNDKIQEIENTKALKQRIENNLQGSY